MSQTMTARKQARMLPLMILGTIPTFSGTAYRRKRCGGHTYSYQHLFYTIRNSFSCSIYLQKIPSIDKDTHGFDGQKNAHAASKPLPIHKVLPADFSLPEHISAPAKLLAPDCDEFSCDFWFLRRRRAVTLIYQIKAQRSGFDLKRKKEIAQ